MIFCCARTKLVFDGIVSNIDAELNVGFQNVLLRVVDYISWHIWNVDSTADNYLEDNEIETYIISACLMQQR